MTQIIGNLIVSLADSVHRLFLIIINHILKSLLQIILYL